MQKSVLQYLEKTASIFPDKVAVVDIHNEITFKQLREKALGLGAEIYNRIREIGQPVLVYLPKSVASIQAFMGIVYSGNFYTPTDISFPFEKVNSIIRQLHPQLYIANNATEQKLLENGINENRIINMDLITPISATVFDWENGSIDTDIVYTLFTSGSTGVPKGVCISHKSIIDYIDWAKNCFDVDETWKIGNQAPFYFDNSTLDIYLCLSTGATLYIVPEVNYAFPAKLMNYIVEKKINSVFWVPSVLVNIANLDILKDINASCLKHILFAGEIMPNKHLNYWRKYIPDAIYANLYGPTEITVDCTYYIVNRKFKDDEPLPIGKACNNSNVFLLNDNNQLVKKCNEVGELCVRGSSLSMGYWNDFERTNAVFVQNPLNNHYPEKIYRTGDLVYYNELLEMIFVGRKDYQIKHMGYRIELGEVENAVLSIGEVKNACALYDDNNKMIILCYEAEKEMEITYIRKKLLSIIPKYMIPSQFIRFDKIPLTSNGKLDRKLLKDNIMKGSLLDG